MENPAEIYNTCKAKLFSLYNSRGDVHAFNYLDACKKELVLPAWTGLKAELLFYHNYRKTFTLDPLWDYGIKADFTGDIDGCNHCRIDVTTNIRYKHLRDYQPIQQKDNRMYKIAIMNPQTGLLEDIVDLNFPFNPTGDGRLFDIALFMPADYNSHGECRYNYYQKIVTVNSAWPDEGYELKDICTDAYIPDIQTFLSDMYEAHADDEEFDGKQELENYLCSTAQYLSKTTGRNIVACAQSKYEITDPRDGDGDYVTRIYWKHPIIADELGDIIDTDIASEI